jgi:hypothetical protein
MDVVGEVVADCSGGGVVASDMVLGVLPGKKSGFSPFIVCGSSLFALLLSDFVPVIADLMLNKPVPKRVGLTFPAASPDWSWLGNSTCSRDMIKLHKNTKKVEKQFYLTLLLLFFLFNEHSNWMMGR